MPQSWISADRKDVPVFFLSYARNRDRLSDFMAEPPSADGAVLRFHQGLCNHVRQLVGTHTGAIPGFIDQQMPGGTGWRAEIIHMLRNTSVFVALLSADYVDSEWCGKEWQAFSQRSFTRRDGKASSSQAAILPVIWSPLPRIRIPPAVQEVQRFAPQIVAGDEIRASYAHNGIYGLAIAENRHYQALVWHLAQLIADFYHTFDCPLGPQLDWDQLRNAFERTDG